MQSVFKENKTALKRWQRTGEMRVREEYRRKIKEAKTKVSEAKREAWSMWCDDLNRRGYTLHGLCTVIESRPI